MHHRPVLLQEVLEYLNPKPGGVVVDGTLGSGGHAAAILERLGPTGRLIGFDQDPAAIERCRGKFAEDDRLIFVRRNFRFIEETLGQMDVDKADAVLLDLGMSSDQLESGERGFSFQKEGDLDMRMDPEVGEKASYYLATLPEAELARVFYEYGEERRSRLFARVLVRERRKAPIVTTQQLSQVIAGSFFGVPKFRKGGKAMWTARNPATKVFQALRILTNDELGALREGMAGAWKRLAVGGRLGVISFHSLEDRMVKEQFRNWARNGVGNLITRKPVVAKRSEIVNDRRARSAKLRVIEKTS